MVAPITGHLPPPPPPPPPPPSYDALHLPPTERPIQFFPPRTGATVSPIFALLRPPPGYPTRFLAPQTDATVTLIAGRFPPTPPPPTTERPIQFFPPRTGATVSPIFARLRPPPGYPTRFLAPRTDAMVTPVAARFPFLPPQTDTTVTPIAARFPPPPPPIPAPEPPMGYPNQFLPPPTDATTDTMVMPLGARLPPPPSPFSVRFPPLPPIDAMADTTVIPSQTERPTIVFTGMLTFLQHQYDSIRREHDVVHNKAAVLDAELNMKMPKPRSSGNSHTDDTVTEELTNLCRQLTQLRDELREIFNLIDEIKTLQYKQKREHPEKIAKDELMADNNFGGEALEGYHAFRKRITELMTGNNKRKKALPIKNYGESSSSQFLQPRLRRSARLQQSARLGEPSKSVLMPGNKRKKALLIKNDGESSSSQSLKPRLRRSARLQQSARLRIIE